MITQEDVQFSENDDSGLPLAPQSDDTKENIQNDSIIVNNDKRNKQKREFSKLWTQFIFMIFGLKHQIINCFFFFLFFLKQANAKGRKQKK